MQPRPRQSTGERAVNSARGQRRRARCSPVTVQSPVALQPVCELVNIPEQLSIPSGQHPESDPLVSRHAPQTGRTALRALVGGTMELRTLGAELAVPTKEAKEDMRLPPNTWTDSTYADDSLEDWRQAYLDDLRGRAKPVSPQTVRKYNQVLQSFMSSLKTHGDPIVLGSLTPDNVRRWVKERREGGLSEEGNGTHLIALKVFTRKFLFQEREVTTVDILRKVPRIAPPEKPAQVLTDEERERVLSCFDQPTYEDTRNVALVACYMATGLRFREILELTVSSIDRIRGDITVIAKGGKTRPARLSPRALKYVREYLRVRPRSDSDRLWLTAEGTPLTYNGAQEMFRKLKRRSGIKRLRSHLLRHTFAQTALRKGAHPGLVQEMLGHSTPTMTRRYLGWAKQEEAARQMPDFSPI
jgi:site-specific recombinase XerD